MIKEKQVAVRRRQRLTEGAKFVLLVTMKKNSDDPREDFRESKLDIIMANRIEEPKDLRSLKLLCIYDSEHYGIIPELFHDVCTRFFYIL